MEDISMSLDTSWNTQLASYKCFVYISELNDYECNDCTTIIILSALHMF